MYELGLATHGHDLTVIIEMENIYLVFYLYQRMFNRL